LDRKSFVTTSFTLAVSGVAQAREPIPGGTHRVERRADFDQQAFAAAVGRPAQIRQLYEATAFEPAVLGSIKNSFNGLQFGFGYPAPAISIVLAGHGPSAAYGYSDYLWKRYRIGEFFKIRDAEGRFVLTNAYLKMRAPLDPGVDPDDDSGMYQDTSIEMLQQRGLIVLTCHTAVEEQARTLVREGFAGPGMTAQDVADDVLTHLVSGALVVPSMVATIAVLQNTYHYAYLSPS
jgi:intracellular sulfur oxidation DsrE/DsrF family protein